MKAMEAMRGNGKWGRRHTPARGFLRACGTLSWLLAYFERSIQFGALLFATLINSAIWSFPMRPNYNCMIQNVKTDKSDFCKPILLNYNWV